jgi:hypothetical protein
MKSNKQDTLLMLGRWAIVVRLVVRRNFPEVENALTADGSDKP